MRASVLIVDDEPIIRETLKEFLQQERFDARVCGSGEEALALAAKSKFDAALCDLHLPGIDGLETLGRLLKISPETLVILITAYATVETAVEAFHAGASDYLIKPVLLHEVLAKLRRLLVQRDLARENTWLRRELSRDESDMVVGTTPAMTRAMEIIHKAAPTPSTVLIVGESGTGKELMARAVHRLAGGNGRFLAVNCAAIPQELWEQQLFGSRGEPGVFVNAGAGTVFLDEVGELPMPMQGKILRVLEQKEVLPVGAGEPVTVAARIVAATSKDLPKEVREGRFREDLYYRLNVVAVHLPPLAQRREDIPELVDRLLAKHARSLGKRLLGASHEAMQLLMNHAWKGNIRELDNALQRAAIVSDGPLIGPSDLPPDVQPSDQDPFAVDDLHAATERFEKLHLARLLRRTPDKREAARRLGIAVSSLYRKIEQHGLGEK